MAKQGVTNAISDYDWDIKKLAWGRDVYALPKRNFCRQIEYWSGDTPEEQHKHKRVITGYMQEGWKQSETVHGERSNDVELKDIHADMAKKLKAAEALASIDQSDHGYFRTYYKWLRNQLLLKDGKTLVSPKYILVSGNRRFDVIPDAAVENITGYGVLTYKKEPKELDLSLEDHQQMTEDTPYNILVQVPKTEDGRFLSDSDRRAIQAMENTSKDQGRKPLTAEELLLTVYEFVKLGHNQNYVRQFASSAGEGVRFWGAANIAFYCDERMAKEGWNMDVLGRFTNPKVHKQGVYIGMASSVVSQQRMQGVAPRFYSEKDMLTAFKKWGEIKPSDLEKNPFKIKKRPSLQETKKILRWLATQKAEKIPPILGRSSIEQFADDQAMGYLPDVVRETFALCLDKDTNEETLKAVFQGRRDGHDMISQRTDDEYDELHLFIQLANQSNDKRFKGDQASFMEIMEAVNKVLTKFPLLNPRDPKYMDVDEDDGEDEFVAPEISEEPTTVEEEPEAEEPKAEEPTPKSTTTKKGTRRKRSPKKKATK